VQRSSGYDPVFSVQKANRGTWLLSPTLEEVSIKMRSTNNVGQIVDCLNRLESEKRLDPETRGQIAKAIKILLHGLSVRSFKEVFKAIDELSKVLSKV
jgi:hypothetical protein